MRRSLGSILLVGTLATGGFVVTDVATAPPAEAARVLINPNQNLKFSLFRAAKPKPKATTVLKCRTINGKTKCSR